MTTISDLNDAISEAHLALEEIDHFDLNSDDPKGNREFHLLNKAHDKAVEKVIKLAVELNTEKK